MPSYGTFWWCYETNFELQEALPEHQWHGQLVQGDLDNNLNANAPPFFNPVNEHEENLT